MGCGLFIKRQPLGTVDLRPKLASSFYDYWEMVTKEAPTSLALQAAV